MKTAVMIIRDQFQPLMRMVPRDPDVDVNDPSVSGVDIPMKWTLLRCPWQDPVPEDPSAKNIPCVGVVNSSASGVRPKKQNTKCV